MKPPLSDQDVARRTKESWLCLMSGRAARLSKLINLGAPMFVIEGEVRLFEQALYAWRKQSGHDYESVWAKLDEMFGNSPGEALQ